MLKKIFQAVAIVVLTSVTALPLGAVTDKEMEEARAITAKAYLRYANDGSGYLDEVSAKTMSELNSKLKAKEKENIKAFNSVKVPTDYASWDKEKLVEFWAVTFFSVFSAVCCFSASLAAFFSAFFISFILSSKRSCRF